MTRKKEKINDKGSIATMGEGHPSQDNQRNGFRWKLKGLLEFCDSATEPKLESMMEKLSPWVAFKRSMNLLDNIFAAGLFSFFVAWTANYLGYHAEPDLGSAISKSLNEIIPGSPKEALLFLFYLCAFWRTIRITRVMPLDRYVDKNILLYVCIAFIAVFIFISLVIYATEKKMILVYGETEKEAQDPNIPFYVAGLRWGAFAALFAYRRILLPRRLKEYKLPDVRIPLPIKKK
ncbi:MAG: hypothetical protein J6X92_02270 [Bacteroidales bacterium]|nr:hypothetical protein [Bacteroidales bacterium]